MQAFLLYGILSPAAYLIHSPHRSQPLALDNAVVWPLISFLYLQGIMGMRGPPGPPGPPVSTPSPPTLTHTHTHTKRNKSTIKELHHYHAAALFLTAHRMLVCCLLSQGSQGHTGHAGEPGEPGQTVSSSLLNTFLITTVITFMINPNSGTLYLKLTRRWVCVLGPRWCSWTPWTFRQSWRGCKWTLSGSTSQKNHLLSVCLWRRK